WYFLLLSCPLRDLLVFRRVCLAEQRQPPLLDDPWRVNWKLVEDALGGVAGEFGDGVRDALLVLKLGERGLPLGPDAVPFGADEAVPLGRWGQPVQVVDRDHAAPSSVSSSSPSRPRSSPVSSSARAALVRRAIRASISGRYSASRSMATHLNPSTMHASMVVPDPANGSRTTPPGGTTRRAIHCISARGFTVG